MTGNFFFHFSQIFNKNVEFQYIGPYIWCVSKLGSNLWPQPKKKIFCGGHCVKCVYPREKVKYVPDR